MSYLNPNAAEARRLKLIVGSAAAAATLGIGVLFWIQATTLVEKPEPKIIYVDSWALTRTRQDAADKQAADKAALGAKLAASRAYIAALPPEKRKLAQAEYDRYLAAPAHERVN